MQGQNANSASHKSPSGYGNEPPRHANDVYTNWSQNSQNMQSGSVKEKPIHAVWNRLQLLDDEIQRMYSTKHDFIEAPTSSYTEAYFKMLPFESSVIALQIILLLFLQILISAILLYIEMPQTVVLGELVASFFILFMYPYAVIVRSKQWVSGGAYTTRFYSHIRNIANLSFTVEVLLIFVLIYTKISISLQSLENFVVEYVPEIITKNSYFDIDKIYFIIENIYIVPLFIFVASLLFYFVALLNIRKKQKRNAVMIHKEINSNANVAESIMGEVE